MSGSAENRLWVSILVVIIAAVVNLLLQIPDPSVSVWVFIPVWIVELGGLISSLFALIKIKKEYKQKGKKEQN